MEDSSESFATLSADGQNLINTFGPVTFLGGVSVEPLAGVGIIDETLTLVNDKLTEFAASPNFETDMQTVFGESVDVDLGRTIIDALSLGEGLPEITVVPAEKMNGIDGGFDSLTGRVYLADTLINPNSVIAGEPTQSPNLADVLIEEFGHLLDWRLDRTDALGDEGQLLAALVRGDELSGPEILEFKDEDDRAEINLGRTVEVEASSRQKRARVRPSFRETFVSQVGEYPTTVAIGELNGDGVADLALTHWFSTDVSVLLGNQNGGFAKATNFFGGGHFLEAVALGEFDGDGALDLALTNLANTSMLSGHGDGRFGDATGFNTAQNPKSVAVGEFNGDGFLDAAVVNVNSHNLSVLLGKGDGSFEEPVHFDAGPHPRSVAVGEFNSDDVLDLAVVNDFDVLILLGDGEGSFSKKGYVDPGYEQRSVAVGEFNGDGISDLAVVDSHYDKVSVMLGNGKGGFGRPNYLDLETYDTPLSVAAGEINGDGLHDLAVVYPWSEKVSVLLNTTPVEPSKPKVSIADTRITEGNNGTKTAKFTVSLDALSTQRVELDYATANDTAKAGRDYETTEGTLVFNAGEISKTIAVPIVGDKIPESAEKFKLKLSNPTNASLVDGEAIATIRDKDVAKVSIQHQQIVEGDNGSKEAIFSVVLNRQSSQEVEVSYATADDSAKAGEDYEATEGTLTFKPGAMKRTIKVPILGDEVNEKVEFFLVNLSDAKNAEIDRKRSIAKIFDNDTVIEDGVPKVSIQGLEIREGNSGSKQATFSVFLNTKSSEEVKVNYATADQNAKAGEDYQATQGTLTFQPGELEKKIVVPILGDVLDEDTEQFQVNLSNPTNSEFGRTRSVVGRILDNDTEPVIDGSEWNATFYEFTGNEPPTNFYLNDSQKLAVKNLGSSEKGFNQDWGSGSPNNIPQDKFAVRSYTHADFEEGKKYIARVRADDGYQLLAKHQTLSDDDPNKWVYITSKDEWREDAYGEHQEIEFTVPNTGKYDLHFHYYENTGDAYFELSWKEVDSKPVVAADFEEVYERNKERLGNPTSGKIPFEGNEYQTFDNGSIVKNNNIEDNKNTFILYGKIRQEYKSKEIGGLGGLLGPPISDRYEWKGGSRQDFENGYIFLGSDSKAYHVFGDFHDVYKENEEKLGVPTSDRKEGSQDFEKGSLVLKDGNVVVEDIDPPPPPPDKKIIPIGLLVENWSESDSINETDFSRCYSFSIDKRSNIQANLTAYDSYLRLSILPEGETEPSVKTTTSSGSVSWILEPGEHKVKIETVDVGDFNYELSLRSVPLVGKKVENKGLTTDKFGKEIDVDPGSSRVGDVNLYRYNKDGRTYQGIESNKKTIVVIHGLNSRSEGENIKKLSTTAAEKYEKDYQVLALDWEELAKDGVPPFDAARAIKPVAEWTKNTLENLGIKAEQITLFGHSLGSYVSAEIAAGLFSGYTYDRLLGWIPNGQEQSVVHRLVALDPAYPGAEYDVDGNAPGFQGIKSFKVATRSLALVAADTGIEVGTVAGDNTVAGAGAHESLVIRYTGISVPDPVDRHSRVIDVFADSLKEDHLKLSNDLALPSDLEQNRYQPNGKRNNSVDPIALIDTFKDGFFLYTTGNPIADRTILGVHEGVIEANPDGKVEKLWYYDGNRQKEDWT